METPDLFFAGGLILDRLNKIIADNPLLRENRVTAGWFTGTGKNHSDLGLYQDAPCYIVYLVENDVNGGQHKSVDSLVYQTEQLWAVDAAVIMPGDQGRAGEDYKFFGQMIWHMRQGLSGMSIPDIYGAGVTLSSLSIEPGRYPIAYRSGFAVQPTCFTVGLTFRSNADRVK